MTGKTMGWRFNADTVNRSMLAKWGADSALFSYSLPDKDHLELNGKFFKTTLGKRYMKDSIFVRMKKKDLNEYTLINHVPHWVNDTIPNW